MSESTTPASEWAQMLPLSLIDPNPFQPRGPIQAESLSDLVESVKAVGILQPVMVSKKGDRYILIAGHRRMAAAQTAGLPEIPCIIKDLSENDLLRYS